MTDTRPSAVRGTKIQELVMLIPRVSSERKSSLRRAHPLDALRTQRVIEVGMLLLHGRPSMITWMSR
jgi:hypothetical protein